MLFLYTAFADGSTFFLNDLLSVKNLIDTFKLFSPFSGLKANFSKCEIAGLGSLKGVLEAVCGLKSVNLTTDTIKIFRCSFFIQWHSQSTKPFPWYSKKYITSGILSLERRIIIFKTIAISKIVYLTFLTVIPNSLIEGLQKIQITFIWQSSRPNISHKTFCNNFLNGGLKHVDISSNIISLQCSWLRKLCDDDFHEKKIIRSHLINKYFGKSLKFYSCLSFDCKLLIKLPKFYKNILFQ